MLGNVVDVDYETMKVSLLHENGALILFDFEAAFPSLSHEYLFKALHSLGVPTDTLFALRRFYRNNTHSLKLKGRCFPSVNSKSGIRQGCPLSPFLFVCLMTVICLGGHDIVDWKIMGGQFYPY